MLKCKLLGLHDNLNSDVNQKFEEFYGLIK